MDEMMVKKKYWDEVNGSLTAAWKKTKWEYMWVVVNVVKMVFGSVVM